MLSAMNEKKQFEPQVIHMTVYNDDDFLSKYGGQEPVINQDVADYLDNAIQALLPRTLRGPLTIDIDSNVISEEESVVYEKAIHKHYENVSLRLRWELKRNARVSLTMLSIGIAILAMLITFNVIGLDTVMKEVFDIIGWVFIWDSADAFFFQRFRLKLEYFRANSLAKAAITYHSHQ